jgi:hypothetical protein
LYELYRTYKEHKPSLRLFLYFLKELKKRKVTSRKDLDDVLKIIDANIALGEEIEDFDTNFPQNLLRGKSPSRVFNQIDEQMFRQNGQTPVPDMYVYSADELEQAFDER